MMSSATCSGSRAASTHLNRASSLNQLSWRWQRLRDAFCMSLTICNCHRSSTFQIAHFLLSRGCATASGLADKPTDHCTAMRGKNEEWTDKDDVDMHMGELAGDTDAHQIGSCDSGGVGFAGVEEVHGLAVTDGPGSASLIRQQPLIQQPLSLLPAPCHTDACQSPHSYA